MSGLIVSVVVGAEPDLIMGCLESLGAVQGAPDLDVRVTCNGPNPSLACELVQRFPGITVRQNDVPGSFAANHNRMLATADADYFLIANDDLRFDPECVAGCLAFLKRPESARVGALSPRS